MTEGTQSATTDNNTSSAVPQPKRPAAANDSAAVRRGTVKQVLSGDAVVLLGPAVNGPPPEITVYFSQVTAPRVGKRPNEGSAGSPDEPFAWDAREWLRKKLVGQVVTFIREFTATSGRDHGRVYLGGTNPENAENVVETGVKEGWLDVRQAKVPDEYNAKLTELRDAAKDAKRGRWAENGGKPRQVIWTIDNPRQLVEKYKNEPVDAVVEQVSNGSTVRVFLLPSMEYVTIQLSGIRTPSLRGQSDGKPEEFGEFAKFFVEARLLQRDVKVILESVSNQNLVGSVLHPRGNIAELLLREGLARCVDWSIALASAGSVALRAAELAAKEKNLRIWKSYKAPAASSGGSSFNATVVEVVLSDALVIQKQDGSELKIHLSSIRLPRESGEGEKQTAPGRQFKPLYDVPFMFEAREFLRKRLIGKTVSVVVDYVQPKSEQFPEKTCCTVTIGGSNIAEALVARGLSKVVRHRQDDPNRSSQYDALMSAEAKAEIAKKGVFADKEQGKTNAVRVQELSGDVARSKQFLSYLQRGGRTEAVVEFVSSGSRVRVYVPKETCLLVFVLSGISCPRAGRQNVPGGGPAQPAEPFGDEAARFTRAQTLQREVELEVESVDKSGGFIGYLFIKQENGARSVNLSELLVEQGLATVHFTAERGSHFTALSSAEQRAKDAKRGLWANYTEPEEQTQEISAAAQAADTSERRVDLTKVVVTDVHPGTMRFSAQKQDDGDRIVRLINELRTHLTANPPTAGTFTPKRGELCAAKFSQDNLWYRARVESVKAGVADLLFIDYGNRESQPTAGLAPLPGQLASSPAGARDYAIALCAAPPASSDYAETSQRELARLLFTASTVYINPEYKTPSGDHVSVQVDIKGERFDLARRLIENGLALAETRREHRLQQLVSEYVEAEKTARTKRRNIWEFGDFTGNDM